MSKIDPDNISNINEISINLECVIDLLISLNPVMCSRCFNIYCEDCSRSFTKCPTCNSSDYQMLKTTNTVVAYEIKKIKIFCNNKQYGCPFAGFIGDVKAHLNQCPYSIELCKEINCGLNSSISKFSRHYIQECQERKLKCYICESLEYIASMKDHLKSCAKRFPECRYCGQYHPLAEIENCRFKIKNCRLCSLPDINKDLESGEHDCFNKDRSNSSSLVPFQSKTSTIPTYLAGVLNKVEKVLEQNLQLKEDSHKNLIDQITLAATRIDSNLDQYLETVNQAYDHEVENAKASEFKKIRGRIDQYIKQIENRKQQLKKIKSNIVKVEYETNKGIMTLSNQFKLQITQKNVNIALLQEALVHKQDKEINSMCFQQMEQKKEEPPKILKFCDICSVEVISDIHCKICNKFVCYDKCVANLNDAIICINCLQCCICGVTTYKGNSLKCFSDRCNNLFCPDCYRVNLHQVRNRNSDCKFTKCKDCDKSAICIMTSRHCGECSYRLCVTCYKSKHLSHNSKIK